MSISSPRDFRRENDVKADFTEIYTAPTPHAYLGEMAHLGYQIGDQAKPYCAAAAEFLKERGSGEEAVRMLDVGCSYGVASALVKYGCSLEELLAFFDGRAPESPEACVWSTSRWLSAVPPERDLEVVGLDSSGPAIAFGEATGLLDDGIPRNLELPEEETTPAEREALRKSNLLVSTGAVGYVTERTFSRVLAELGRDRHDGVGPVGILTVLRMFDAAPIVDCFEAAGLRMEALPDVLLPQRAFANDEERDSILEILRERGVETNGLESEGVLFAELYVAATHEHFDEFRTWVEKSVSRPRPDAEPLLATHVEVARAGVS